MRTKRLAVMLAGALVFIMAVGCGEAGREQDKGDDGQAQTPAVHTHTFSEYWSYDPQYHWHFASCEHKTMADGLEKHSFENGSCATCGYFSKDGVDISSYVSEKVSKEEWESALSDESLGNCKMYGVNFGSDFTTECYYYQNGGNIRIELEMVGMARKQEIIIMFRGDEVDTYIADTRGLQQEPQWEHESGNLEEFMGDGSYLSACNGILLKEIAKHFDQAKFDEARGEYVISSKDMDVPWGVDFHLKFQNGKLRGFLGPILPCWMVVYGYGETEEIIPPAEITE